jgi:drug/metabolite transporter (DMT)-like permease
MSFGLGEFYSLACALAWAAAVILFKKSGESLPPIPLNLFKNVLGLGLMVVTAVAVTGPVMPEIPAGAMLAALFSGFLGIGVGDSLYFRALNTLGASRMGIAQTMYSPFVIVLAAIFLGERLGTLQLAGVALVLGGIVLVNDLRGSHADARALRRGVAEAAASVFVMAVGVIISKPLLERYDFFWIVSWRLAGGSLGLLMFLALRRETGRTWAEFGAVRHWPHVIAGSILGAYVSMMLWLAGYKYTQASIAAVLNEMAAVFIIALAAVFLKDRLKPAQLAGSLLAVAGVVLVVWR